MSGEFAEIFSWKLSTELRLYTPMRQIDAIARITKVDNELFFRIFDQILIEFSSKLVLSSSTKIWSPKPNPPFVFLFSAAWGFVLNFSKNNQNSASEPEKHWTYNMLCCISPNEYVYDCVYFLSLLTVFIVSITLFWTCWRLRKHAIQILS